MNQRLLAAGSLLVALGASGCASVLVDPAGPVSPHAGVTPVRTEHSDALACLGRLIDRSGRPTLVIHVEDIADRTVPERFEGRRLSGGASWWLHTAIGKIGSKRVVSTTESPSRREKTRHLVLAGAWTQDDLKVGRSGAEFSALLSRIGLGLGARRSYDIIAGDFVSSRNGRVVHATGISLQVGAGEAGMNLRIDDGNRRFEFGLTDEVNEGPQFAQRRITEAAALVHIAEAFGVDYRKCLAAQQGSK